MWECIWTHTPDFLALVGVWQRWDECFLMSAWEESDYPSLGVLMETQWIRKPQGMIYTEHVPKLFFQIWAHYKDPNVWFWCVVCIWHHKQKYCFFRRVLMAAWPGISYAASNLASRPTDGGARYVFVLCGNQIARSHDRWTYSLCSRQARDVSLWFARYHGASLIKHQEGRKT